MLDTFQTMSACQATPTPSACVTTAAADAAANDASKTCGSANQIVRITSVATCPAATPVQYTCVPKVKNAAYCCAVGAKAGSKEGCDICPKSGCSHILGGGGSGVCFADSSDCPPSTNPANAGQAVTRCPAFVSTKGSIATACQSWCNANPEECNRDLKAYCSAPGNAGLAACSCVAPQGTDWGDLSYKQLLTIVRANPKVEKQLQDQGLDDIRCAWPPCQDQSGGILKEAATSGNAFKCPDINNLCVNVLEDVHLSDVIAGKVTIGACIGKTNTTGGGGNNTTGGGGNTESFGGQLEHYLVTHPVIIVMLVVVAVLAVVTPLAWAAHALAKPRAPADGHKQLKQSMRMIRSMGASKNAQVRAASQKLREAMTTQQQQALTDLRAQRDKLSEQTGRLRAYESTNAVAALKIARMAGQLDQLQDGIDATTQVLNELRVTDEA